jgi:sigma-B regulation protein RsbU (phosphoserine phosphatase)
VALTGESISLSDTGGNRFELDGLLPIHEQPGYKAVSLLAVPLRSGQIVGALLLANSTHTLMEAIVPFDAYHQQVAESLASQAAVVLNNRLLNERQGQLLRFKRELEIGREIQLSFLPAQLPEPAGWELKARFRPALEVAGDFYDAFLLPNGCLAVVIADVVGKGVTAALFMAIIRSLFRGLFQQHYYRPAAQSGNATLPVADGEALLNAVRLTSAYLFSNHGDTYTFATLFAGVLDPTTGRLIYVNAGHNPPLLLGANGHGGRSLRQELTPTGPAIGLLPNLPFRLAETALRPGELLLTFTDGITEARNPASEEWGDERLVALLEMSDGSAEVTLTTIEVAVQAHMGGAEAFDDMTLLALRRTD